jgi:hypothetical protein
MTTPDEQLQAEAIKDAQASEEKAEKSNTFDDWLDAARAYAMAGNTSKADECLTNAKNANPHS